MVTNTRLSDLQLVLLSHARSDTGHIYPLPLTATRHEERTAKVLKSLLRRKLIDG